MPPHARSWRSEVGAWSPLEVAHHLALIEAQVLGGMTGDATGARRAQDRIGRIGLRAVFRFGLRVSIPTEAVRPDPTLPMGEVDEIWTEAREALLEHLRGLDHEALREARFRHPVAGPLSPLGWIDFLVDHQNHHFRQLHRIRSRPDFPWNV